MGQHSDCVFIHFLLFVRRTYLLMKNAVSAQSRIIAVGQLFLNVLSTGITDVTISIHDSKIVKI